ncbi:MAG: hypothetical protein Q8O59_02180, partial [bacterium]|nr:hypothetical protein [bacterium]
QEIKEVIPQMVSVGGDGYFWYNPSGFEAILTAAVQELYAKIQPLAGVDGNVGIGTTSPGAKLEVSGSSGTAQMFVASTNSGSAELRLSNTLANWANYVDSNNKYYIRDRAAGLDRVTINSDGNVGIGTTSPSQGLHIGANASGKNVMIAKGGLCVDDDDSCAAAFADGKIVAKTSDLTGADYAEYFKTADTDLTAGQTVCVDVTASNAVKRCVRGHDNNVMGIVSSNPSIVGNARDEVYNNPNYVIVGMLGQVDALVSAENGPIAVGDSLTSASSTPGYAMKADGGDSTVAVALEPLKEGKGKIKVLISRRNKSLAVEQVETLVVERVAGMKIEDQVQVMIKQSVDNLNLDPKIIKIAQEEADKLDAALTVSLDNMNNQIIALRSATLQNDSLIAALGSSFYITDNGGNAVFYGNRDTGALLNREIALTAENIYLHGTTTADVLCLGGECRSSWPETPSVQVIDLTEITASSSSAALVVNQQGPGDIADFQSGGVSIMNIDNQGQVKIMGSLLVDGRIMLCSGGFCSDTLDNAVDETRADLGVEGKVVAGAFEGYCEDGYVWAPGSAKYGTLPGFCVQADLMGTNVSQGEAQLACQQVGAGYHLIGENEWLTIAENALRAGLSASSTDIKLTNDNVIHNLTGEAAQWTNQNVTAAGLPVAPSAGAWYEYNEVVDFKGLNIAPDYYLSHAKNNIGKIKVGSAPGLKGFVRGEGGIYGLDLSHAPAEQSADIGFRCAK